MIKNLIKLKLSEKFYNNEGNINILNSISCKSKYILDVGCGASNNAKRLNQMGKIVDGITLSETEAEKAKKYSRNIFLYNLENGLPKEIASKYDVILCSHVLEHIAYPQKLLSEIKHHLNTDGILLIALPNFMSYKNRLKMLFGKFEYEEYGIMDYTHLRWYTFSSAQRLLEDNGYKVKKAWVEGGIPFQRYLNFLPYKVKKIIKIILYSISKGFFGGELLYIAESR